MDATASSKFSDVDEYGFKRGQNFDYRNYSKFMDGYLKTLTRRRMKWEAILQQNPDLSQVDAKLKRYIRKGIPGPYRPDVWMKISGAAAEQRRAPNLYRSLLNSETFDKEISDSISIDLPRTFPDNIHFDTKKQRLYNILIAYAHHNRDVGYCQGLNYIAGLLLIVTEDEEKSFWLLKHIVENIVPQYHSHNMSNLLRDLAVFRELVIRRVPAVNRHVDNLGLPYPVIASKWFICIFAEVLPVETVLRIWDCVFAEGYKIVFRAALAMFVTHKTSILACDDIAALANHFRDIMIQDSIVTDCHGFIESMFALRLKRSELESLRKVAVLNPA
ncbi:growth hormone-regulated TBC protein 1-A [Drosophila madeirensis]|uniref:Growth hormone-regulated TBC protein 1 n=2 Tax=obscura subgroup TaxID=32357 RepID=A0A3B0KF30_DROGU|nr:growth hormone-regulated TBC protein 1-A [Drosophila guanche]XP_034665972.1 growth hormone-regulated TBC protein 1-A [Drosophila subobscura]SPP83661.1 blast:Growth hormone-regulated TBC protein 1-A [Drosophila guanche]